MAKSIKDMPPPTGEYKEFALRYRKGLLYAGIDGSLRAISEELKSRGVERGGASFIGNVLRGEQCPTGKTLDQTCKAMKVNKAWLLDGTLPMVSGKTEKITFDELTLEEQEIILAIRRSRKPN